MYPGRVLPLSAAILSLSYAASMISDNELYSLAIFLGSLSMLLIVLYHFLEVNAQDEPAETMATTEKVGSRPVAQGGGRVSTR